MVDDGGRTFHWGKAGNVGVFVHGHKEPREKEWRDSIDQLAAQADTMKGVLVYTLGGGPNSTQRKYLADMWLRRGAMLPTALVTPSSVVRGIVTALNWVLPKPIRTFSPDQVQEAMRFLQLDDDDARIAVAKLAEFRAALGVVDQGDRLKTG